VRIAIVLILILLLGAVSAASWSGFHSVRGRLARQREAIASEWAQVDLAIERRAGLVAHLEPSARAADAALWNQLHAAAAALEASATPADKIRANDRLSALLAGLPRTEPGATLQRLSDAENRIDVERRRYNEMLEHYNADIQHFPDNIVAAIAGFSRDDAYLPTPTGQ
jgi:LemA protein